MNMEKQDVVVRSIISGIVEYWQREFEPHLPIERSATFAATLHDIYWKYQRGNFESCFETINHLTYAFSGDTMFPRGAMIGRNIHNLFTVMAADFIRTQTEDIELVRDYSKIKNSDCLLILARETATFQFAFGSKEQQVIVGGINAAGEQYFESGFRYRKAMRLQTLVFKNGGVVDSLEKITGRRIYESTVEEGLVYRVENLLMD